MTALRQLCPIFVGLVLLLHSCLVACTKFPELAELEQARSDLLIPLNKENFESYFVVKKPEFLSVLFLTTSGGHCVPCLELYDALSDLTKKIRSARALGKDGKEVYFFRINLDEEQTLNKYLRFSDIPHVYVLSSNSLTFWNKSSEIQNPTSLSQITSIKFAKNAKFVPVGGQVRDVLVPFLERRMGLSADVLRQPHVSLGHRLAVGLGAVVVLGLGIALFAAFREFVLSNPLSVPILAIGVFALSCSGLIYTLQHGMMMWGPSRDGSKVFLDTRGRSQFGMEGLVFGFSGTLGFLCLHFALSLLVSNKEKQSYLRVIGAVILTIACLLLTGAVMMAFRIKYPYGAPTFFPPDGFVTGSSRHDRGYSFP